MPMESSEPIGEASERSTQKVGGKLPDPTHLLEGTGKRMRHVKMKSVEDANNPALEELINAAWKDAQISLPQRHKKMRL